MGIVWEGQTEDASRRVAVKQPRLREVDRRIAVERLSFEVEALRLLNDEVAPVAANTDQGLLREHVVRYVDGCNDPNNPVLILEFVNGSALSAATIKVPLNENIAIQHISTLLGVVRALHSRGVIHRDISPGNILLNSFRGIVLIDFGTCFFSRSDLQKTNPERGKVVFKRGYSPPELLTGLSDERSDIFSVGATLFYLVTGRNPADYMDNSYQLTRSPKMLNKRMSTAVSNIAETAMSVHPDNRFQTTTAMLAALENEAKSHRGPKITTGGIMIDLKAGSIDIGREHTCDRSCEALGFKHPPQIKIADRQRYVDKHHVRIFVDSNGTCFIEDLNSINHTAIIFKSGVVKVLTPSEKVKLPDQSTIALAYSPSRGPYVALEFDAK